MASFYGLSLSTCHLTLQNNAYLSFHSMKQLRRIAAPPGWDASPSQVTPEFCQVSLTVRRYPFILLRGERNCENKLTCPRTQHNDPARTQTTQYVQWINYKATASFEVSRLGVIH